VARRYSQIDPWFLQRGYKRTGTRECYYWLRQGDLLFRLSITASPSKYDHTKWTTLITYFASLPKFGKLHVELLQNSSFSVPPTGANSKLKGAFAMSRNYVAGQRGFPWVRHFLHLENEAYSAAGGMGFGWWLVEHYLSYHVNCPDGCGLGEPTRGRKDPPYFQMSYGSFDNIADLVDTLVESPLPLQQGSAWSFFERCVTS